MPTTQDGKKTGSAARAEQNDGTFTSQDTFSNPALLELTTTATATDAQGIERVVIPSTEAFTPAPLEATDDQKQHMERLNSTLKQAADTRAAMLRGEVKDEERAPNTPGDAGSQTGPASQADQEKAGAASDDKPTQAKSDDKKGK